MVILECMSHFTEVNLAWVKLGQVRKIDVAKEELSCPYEPHSISKGLVMGL